jgi:hypothetical protein
MDRLRIKLTSQELHEMNEFLGLCSGITPAALRSREPQADAYAGACAIALLLSRLHVRTSVMSIRSKGEVRLNVPAEEGHALVYMWLRAPQTEVGTYYMHLRNIVGRIQQALA